MKVLLFQLDKNICNDLFGGLNYYLRKTLSKQGIDCEIACCTCDAEMARESIISGLERGCDLAIGFNAVEQILEISTREGENIYDHYGVPFYNWIVDPPIERYGSFFTTCQNYHVLCMDLNHKDQIMRLFPNVKSAEYLPLGGIEPSKGSDRIPIDQREFEVVLTAGFMQQTPKEMLEVIKTYEEPVRSITLRMIECMLGNRNLDAEEALRIVLGEDLDPDKLALEQYRDCVRYTYGAHCFMRYFVRKEIVQTLVTSPLRLHLFGNGWKEYLGMESTYSRTTFHKGVSFLETSEIFGRSRIVMNIMPWFKNGTHDRIASGMLHGAAVCTDHSRYLDSLPDGIMNFYSLDMIKYLPELIGDYLRDPVKLQETADRGSAYATENMTWDAVVKKLLEIVEKDREASVK